MTRRILVWCGLLTMWAVCPAAAQRYFISRVPTGTAASVAGQNGYVLVNVHSAGGQDLAQFADYSVQFARAQTQTPITTAATQTFEPDATVRLGETANARLNQSTVGILDSAGRTDLVSYWNGQAWSGYTKQPAGQIINLDDVQRFFALGLGTVAVIDTGVDTTHPVLQGVLTYGYDFVRNQPGGSEMADVDQSTVGILDRHSVTVLRNRVAKVNQSTVGILDQSTVGILDTSKLPAAFGHGTMVSGLVHYVAPNARILPLKAFRSDGTGNLYDILRAIYYAVDHGAKVINMSFSMDGASPELQAALSYANSKRVVCVGSAGNSSANVLVYPAAWKTVEGVGSTNNSDIRSLFSNYGDGLVSVAAPGENLITTYPGNNYAGVSGTSFSAALVSGAATLLNQLHHNITQAEASAALAQAHPVGQGLGAGRIDLTKASFYALLH